MLPDWRVTTCCLFLVIACMFILNLDAFCKERPAERDYLYHTECDVSFALVSYTVSYAYAYQRNLVERTRSQFVSSISHELRTPLQGILGASELLLDTRRLQGEDLENVTTIFGCGQLLSSLINNILDAAGYQSGRRYTGVSQSHRSFRPLQLCQRLISVVKHMAQYKEIHFSTAYVGQRPGCCIGDGDAVSQVLLNLLSNAIKVSILRMATTRNGLVDTSRVLRDKTRDRGFCVPQHIFFPHSLTISWRQT